ncbi:MAG: response regulator [Spirochaetaceae bacterium]|nr:MAG: response regulator [Spirochaetaceae bacterium]
MKPKVDAAKLKLIYLEDSAQDVELLRELLTDAGFDLEMDCTATENEFLSFLQDPSYDIILADFKLPGFDAFGALRHSREICPDVPFICVSGSIGEETAVELLKQGAADYLLKDRLEKLPSAIKRALAEAGEKQALRYAGKALQASETRYRRLFETAKDGILILDAASGLITEVNPCLVEMLGVTSEPFLGKKIWEMEFFRNIAANQDSFAELQRKDCSHYDDLLLETADGRRIEAEFVSNAYKVNYRKVIQCNIRDITERKRIEKALLALSLRQKSILSAVPDIIMEVDGNKVYVWANNAGIAFFGDDVIGKEAQYYFEGEQETYDMVKPIFSGDENVIYIESWQRRKDGEKRLLAWWCRVLKDENNNVIGALSSAQDITERKRAEEENRILSKFPSQNPNPVLRILRNGTLLFVNEAGMNQLSEWHLTAGNQVPPAMGEAVYEALQGESPQNKDFECGGRTFSFFIAPISGRDYANLYGFDITERKRSEEEIKNRIIELERFHRLAVGRETKMIELKQKINELSARLGLAPPYPLDFVEANNKSNFENQNTITGDKIL